MVMVNLAIDKVFGARTAYLSEKFCQTTPDTERIGDDRSAASDPVPGAIQPRKVRASVLTGTLARTLFSTSPPGCQERGPRGQSGVYCLGMWKQNKGIIILVLMVGTGYGVHMLYRYVKIRQDSAKRAAEVVHLKLDDDDVTEIGVGVPL